MKYEKVEAISKFLQSKTKIRPKLGIIAGSGLGGLADRLEEREEIPYSDIPDFPISTGKYSRHVMITVNLISHST